MRLSGSIYFAMALLTLAGSAKAEKAADAQTAGEQDAAPILKKDDGMKTATTDYPEPKWYRVDNSIHCDNGMIRIRPMESGIIWFDVYHPREKKWYVNKNNLNLSVQIRDHGWKNTELDRVPGRVTIVKEGPNELVLNYGFDFPNEARIFTYVTLKKGMPSARFEVHEVATSAKIDGFQWQVTFGQAEAVKNLTFDGREIKTDALPKPFPGGRVQVQHLEWFHGLRDLNFRFQGNETAVRDPKNPVWMTRVLGLKQHVIWGKPMRAVDAFAFEARDQPWQPDWEVPDERPWIEGLWFVRNGGVLEGDSLIFHIDDYADLGRPEQH